MHIYKELKALNVELNDDVRGVFDRMLASGEQIQPVEQWRSVMSLFTSLEQAGMMPEEFAAWEALGVDATSQDQQGARIASRRRTVSRMNLKRCRSG
ncbi:hypothetical protein [Thauera sinica]|uniref:Uncharacterized protein n=1 Tax=Thauera sinica TaxID=2665146 RepID=A0ABW1ALD8_9RHOO|nr:hypothetical protein [Thauera sp. K11]ATE59105.1 hypothetical protein CCZ27_03270 [Thauera sp. K11]